jgi:diguanylate cyclase (GGDEF)-like protein/putative nucleotidyltransferase with HDIG domain
VVEEQTLEVRDGRRLFGRLSRNRRSNGSEVPGATVDKLTGLRNHRALWRELARRSQACSPDRPLAVVMMDLDLLRQVNESYGRDVGDAVLKRTASVIRSTVPFPRLAFRYGGEEFVVLVEPQNGEASELAERVRAEIAAQNGALPTVTVSCGIAELDTPVEPWVALDRADAALRQAKRSGRNRVAVAGHTSPGERVMLVEELERDTARRAAMALAVATLEVRDTGTADHSDDVLTLCEAIGRKLEFDERALQHLRAGAQLHDLGKVAIPSSILNKPGALNDEEWAVIREHTVIGERILRSVPEMSEVATIVRHSHERWDGGGYPDGLSGEQIPLASRVILCADAFHAIRSDRPYRQGRPADQAIAEVRACAGAQFDPVVVAAFVGVIEETRKSSQTVVVGPRNRRLVALLTALVIGGGSAVAGIPELRDAIRNVFGAGTGPSQAVPGDVVPGAGWIEFGRLGDALRMKPAADRERGAGEKGSSRKPAKDAERRRGGSGPKDDRGAFTPSKGAGDGSAGGTIRGTAAPNTPPSSTAPADSGSPAPSEPGPVNGETNGGDVAEPVEKAKGDGNGKGLGKGVPTPRRSKQPPPHQGGRPDPPALGHTEPSTPAPAPTGGNGNGGGNGKAKGHSK